MFDVETMLSEDSNLPAQQTIFWQSDTKPSQFVNFKIIKIESETAEAANDKMIVDL